MPYVILKINIHSYFFQLTWKKMLKILCIFLTILDAVQEYKNYTHTIQFLKYISLIKYSCSQSTFCKRVSIMIIYQKRYLFTMLYVTGLKVYSRNKPIIRPASSSRFKHPSFYYSQQCFELKFRKGTGKSLSSR